VEARIDHRSATFRRLFLWVAPGVIAGVLAVIATGYRVQLVPPSLKSDSAVYAAATTQVLVDFPRESALLSTRFPIEPLADRANVYARLAASPAIRDLIGSEAGIDPAAIDVAGPYNPGAERFLREPTAERRATQLEAERHSYRLRFDSESSESVPIVLIYAQAPTVAAAERLADAGAIGLGKYLTRVQASEDLENDQRLRVEPLGKAVGGIVNPGADREIAVLVFAATLLAWTTLALLFNQLLGLFRARLDAPPGETSAGTARGRDAAPGLDAPAVGSGR